MKNFIQITDTPMQLGESPFWHPHESALYWIDIADRALHRFEPLTQTQRNWSLPAEPGCIAPCREGGIVIGLRSGLGLLDTDSGALTELARAPYDQSVIRFNDGACDQAGRLWIGSLYEPRDHAGAALYCVERGVIHDSGLRATVSNGVAFSPDQRTLYHADTTAHRISAYRFDLKSGAIGEGRVFHQFDSDRSTSNYGGRPDGAAVDSEGAYWCALYEGGAIARFDVDGTLLQKIELPLRCPTMLAFGGADLRTLFITSVRQHRSAEELQRYPLSGHVLALPAPVAGLPVNFYRR